MQGKYKMVNFASFKGFIITIVLNSFTGCLELLSAFMLPVNLVFVFNIYWENRCINKSAFNWKGFCNMISVKKYILY